jgi:hypothetical protein
MRSVRVRNLGGSVRNALQLIADDSLGQEEWLDLLRFDPRVLAGSVLVRLSIERQRQRCW